MTANDFAAPRPSLYSAVIPVAGLGTRTWPISMPGVVAETFLPAQDKMLIVAAIDEALEADVKRIIIVSSEAEQPRFRRLFSRDEALEAELVGDSDEGNSVFRSEIDKDRSSLSRAFSC